MNRTSLSRFTRDKIEAEEIVEFEVELGTPPNVLKITMEFMIVNISCVHNAILRRLGIAKTRAIISMTHLSMKFYTPNGVGVVKGNKKSAQKCYLEVTKRINREDARINTIS